MPYWMLYLAIVGECDTPILEALTAVTSVRMQLIQEHKLCRELLQKHAFSRDIQTYRPQCGTLLSEPVLEAHLYTVDGYLMSLHRTENAFELTIRNRYEQYRIVRRTQMKIQDEALVQTHFPSFALYGSRPHDILWHYFTEAERWPACEIQWFLVGLIVFASLVIIGALTSTMWLLESCGAVLVLMLVGGLAYLIYDRAQRHILSPLR